MAILKKTCEKIILIIVTISILIMFFSTPSAYAAKLDLEEGDFYYSGTTKGTYTVTQGIFAWLLENIGDIADWLLGIMTMGFRMVFVGWTALFEKLLTWALETTTGVDLAGNLVANSTDTTALTDSSNNLTVEAIVFNKVPALNINFFEESQKDCSISGTGQKLICEGCDKPVDDEGCCGPTEDDGNGGKKAKNAECACDCNGCDACTKYRQAIAAYGQAIIDKIKGLVATWFYILRLLSIAAMLIVLIVIGIKMAISTVASDKAVYKRMLVDWLAGFIVLIFIHYGIYATIKINEIAVSTVEHFAVELNRDKIENLELMQLAETSDTDLNEGNEEGTSGYTNDELEIKVYEEIRTRAYDPKLSVGLTGMIMYMTLVYFAVRYTIVYVKRYFTVIVLTLMGPPLGVAYALQKALSGNTPSMKKWTSEFISTVFIQVIHAILYGVFVIQALILSLGSVAGMIIALVFMNYVLKADKLFRKIFKIGTGGSIAGEAADAGDPDNIKSSFNAFNALLTAEGTKELAKTMTKMPHVTAAKALGKVAVAGAAVGAVGIGKGAAAVGKGAAAIGKGMFGRTSSADPQPESGSEGGTSAPRGDAKPIPRTRRQSERQARNEADQQLLGTGEKTLKKQYEAANDEYMKAKTPEEKNAAMQKILAARANLDRYEKITTPTTFQVGKAHVQRALDLQNIFRVSKYGSAKYNAVAIYRGIFGTKHRDPETKRMVSDGNALYHQFSATNLLGLTKEDKAELKKMFKQGKDGVFGLVAMFVGMGTIVAHPTLGMALLAGGHSKFNAAFGKRTPNIQDYKGRYTFNRFSGSAVQNMANTVTNQAKYEAELLNIAKAEQEQRGILRRLRNGTLNVLKFPVITLPAYAGLTLARSAKYVGRRFTTGTRLAGSYEEFRENAMERQRKFRNDNFQKFEKEAAEVMKAEYIADMAMLANRGADQEHQEEEREEFSMFGEALEELGYEYDQETGEIYSKDVVETSSTSDTEEAKAKKKQRRVFQSALVEYHRARGFDYDPETGTLTKRKKERTMVKGDIKEDKKEDNDPKSLVKYVGTKRLTQTDCTVIYKELDAALEKVANGKLLDINDERNYDEVVKVLSDRLASIGLLDGNQTAKALFKKGKFDKTLRDKTVKMNARIDASNAALEKTLSKPEADQVRAAVESLLTETTSGAKKDISQITPEEVLGKMKTNMFANADGSQRVPKKDGSVRVKQTDGVNPVNPDASNPTDPDMAPDMPQPEAPVIEDEAKKLAVIAEYLEVMQQESKKAEVTRQATEKVNERRPEIRQRASAKSEARREKMRQIIEFSMDVNDQEDPLEATFEKLAGMKGTGGDIEVDGGTVHLDSSDVDAQLEMLFLVKQMRALNEVSVEELGVHRKNKPKAQSFGEDINGLERKKLEYNGLLSEYGPNDARTKAAKKELDELQAGLEQKQLQQQMQQRLEERAEFFEGPFIDIRSEVGKTLSGREYIPTEYRADRRTRTENNRRNNGGNAGGTDTNIGNTGGNTNSNTGNGGTTADSNAGSAQPRTRKTQAPKRTRPDPTATRDQKTTQARRAKRNKK